MASIMASIGTSITCLRNRRRNYLVIFALVICFSSLISSAGAQTGDTIIVEQHKAYLSDFGNIGARYAATNTFYITIISGLIAVFSFKEMNRPLRDYVNAASITMFFFIAVICWLWWNTLQFYHDVFDQKFVVLQQIEMSDSRLFRAFVYERQHHPTRGLTQRDSDVALFVGSCAALAFVIAICIQLFRLWRPAANDPPPNPPEVIVVEGRMEIETATSPARPGS
jgi:lysylphosphatidylglycerol synthetase-like protein (DUF2156 family)